MDFSRAGPPFLMPQTKLACAPTLRPYGKHSTGAILAGGAARGPRDDRRVVRVLALSAVLGRLRGVQLRDFRLDLRDRLGGRAYFPVRGIERFFVDGETGE